MLSTPFHLHLPSDANRALYPDNRAADYKVQLQHAITLSDKTPWEVGVTDIIVPSNIQSTETEAWFQIQNVKGEVSKKFYVPGLHFYKSTQDFLTKFRTKLHRAMRELKKASFIDKRDEITLTFKENPPHFTIRTRLRQFADSNAMFQSEAYNGLILNQELSNLFGLPDKTHLTSNNTYRQWRNVEVPVWYNDKRDLWLSVSGYGQSDREEVKHFLPNIRSYRYRDKDHFLGLLMRTVNQALRTAKQSNKIADNDNISLGENSERLTFVFKTRLNGLPGRDIRDTTRLNGVTFSPALAYVLGLAQPWSNRPVRLIARNYYIEYMNSDYTEDKYRTDDWVADPAEYWNLGIHVYGRYTITLKPGGISDNNPADLADSSVSESKLIFARTHPLVDVSKKTLHHYVEQRVSGNRLPVGRFITKYNDIMIQENDSSHHNVATSTFYLNSQVKVKSGHQQINIYSDGLVDTHCIGNEMKSLLRTVTHNRKTKKRKREEEEEVPSLKEINLSVPYYVPVKPGLRELKDITIRVEDEHNHRMPFAPGKTSLDLHFRPAKRQKVSQFTVSVPCCEDIELQREYEISQQWSVCLVDLHFPFSWKHVLGEEMKATVQVNNSFTDVTVPPGEYTTQTFLAALDKVIRKVPGNNVKLVKESGNKFHNPVVFEVKTDPYNKAQANNIQLSSDLAQVLGLFETATLTDTWRQGTGNQASLNWQALPDAEEQTKHNITVEYTRRADRGSTAALTPPNNREVSGAYRKTKFTFSRHVDLNRGFKLFYVYAPDLIESVHLGHTKVPLLRQFIPRISNKANGEFVHQEFITPHYKQIKAGVNSVKKLNVSVTDELGRLIQFTGNVKPTATLHFQHK